MHIMLTQNTDILHFAIITLEINLVDRDLDDKTHQQNSKY
jgi:hypothetical protein